MRASSLVGAAFVTVCAFSLLVAFQAVAENGRHFAGNYSVSNVTQSGSDSTLTFSTQVFNYSGSDVANATISLQAFNDPTTVYASFTGVNITADGNVRLSSQASVPSSEYDGWQQGNGPSVVIQFTDNNGNSLTEKVEVALVPATQ
jgi:hypothetical protein